MTPWQRASAWWLGSMRYRCGSSGGSSLQLWALVVAWPMQLAAPSRLCHQSATVLEATTCLFQLGTDPTYRPSRICSDETSSAAAKFHHSGSFAKQFSFRVTCTLFPMLCNLLHGCSLGIANRALELLEFAQSLDGNRVARTAWAAGQKHGLPGCDSCPHMST